MQHAGAFDDVVHAIYDAALTPAYWEEVLGKICVLLDARSALLFTPQHGPSGCAFISFNVSWLAMRVYAQRFGAEDSFSLAALAEALCRTGSVSMSESRLRLETSQRSRAHQELLEPFDTVRQMSATVLNQEDSPAHPTVLTLFRGMEDADFGNDEVEVLRRMVIHISRSLAMLCRLERARLFADGNMAALDHLKTPAFLLDTQGFVCVHNHAARQLVDAARILELDRKRSLNDVFLPSRPT